MVKCVNTTLHFSFKEMNYGISTLAVLEKVMKIEDGCWSSHYEYGQKNHSSDQQVVLHYSNEVDFPTTT
jgi:hypothetical protein